MKPRIAIPVPNSVDQAYTARVLPSYGKAVRDSGGEPVLIDIKGTPSQIAQAVKSCDGVLLPGSPADVDPEKYGAVRHPKTAYADPFRDNTDELLLQDAYNMRKPVLAICYGVQSLNVWRTGTLIQHLNEQPVNHNNRDAAIAHQAKLDPHSRLARILRNHGLLEQDREQVVSVNSSHHQAIDVVGDGLQLVATAVEDGVAEAVEGTAPDHFVLGVQWHPERDFATDEVSQAIFLAFVKAAGQWHKALRWRQQDFESAQQ